MSEPLLQVTNLHVEFADEGKTAKVLNGIDFQVNRGETIGLIGETGCGKSVTAKSILGLLPESAAIPEGEIWFRGENLLKKSAKERHSMRGVEMSIIMQDPMTSLNPVYTVGEQMLDVLKWHGQRRVGFLDWLRDKFRDNDELKREAVEMLEDVQISAPERVFDSYPSELSGGMRQRVLIAIALLLEPDFLIADEPGTALDVTTEAKILQLIDDLVADTDTAVLYISHDLGVAKEISNKINVMYAGEIVEKALTAELFERPQHPYTRGLLDSIPHLSVPMGEGIKGSLPDYTNPPTGCRFADRCPESEPECTKYYPYPRQTEDQHSTACHLYSGLPSYKRHQELSAGQNINIGNPSWNLKMESSREFNE